MKIAFYGSSLLSAYWNGAATYYRGMLGELARIDVRACIRASSMETSSVMPRMARVTTVTTMANQLLLTPASMLWLPAGNSAAIMPV